MSGLFGIERPGEKLSAVELTTIDAPTSTLAWRGTKMGFHFPDLDDATRALMSEELGADVAGGSVYLSPRLSAEGAATWPSLLGDAMASGDESTLTDSLGAPGERLILAVEPNAKTGGDKQVPWNAPSTLAEGEFNRFYIRAVCRRAIESRQSVEVFRSRASANPDPRSEAIIGSQVDPEALLGDLRANQGVATALGLPPHPNSGLSVRLV